MSEKERGVYVNRPISPHLTIYKPQITSVLSIMHRFSGVALFLGTLFLACWIIINVYCGNSCISGVAGSVFGKTVLFLWSAALYYHLLNGIRHLYWDVGLGFEVKTVENSGIAVIIGTMVLLMLTWVCFSGVMVGLRTSTLNSLASSDGEVAADI